MHEISGKQYAPAFLAVHTLNCCLSLKKSLSQFFERVTYQISDRRLWFVLPKFCPCAIVRVRLEIQFIVKGRQEGGV